MKFFNPTFLILLCLIVPSICLSQEFFPGYYISLSNDTIRGNFSSPSKTANAVFYFRQHLADDRIVKIDLNQCKELSAGKKNYISWFGKRNVSYVHKIEKTVINDSLGITGDIPLKELFKGNKLSLYYFEDETAHFFVKIEGAVQELLVMYRYSTEWERKPFLINPPTYNYYPVYRNQLIGVMGDKMTDNLMVRIENVEYQENQLVKLFKKMDAAL
jgi:hypothetical protein